MNIFDRFLVGDMDNVDLNLNNPHINESIRKNSLNREDVINALLYEEVSDWEMGHDGRLVVFYTCEALNTSPMAKDHKYYKMVLNSLNGSLNVVTVIPETRLFRDSVSKRRDKQVAKAFSKRKRY